MPTEIPTYSDPYGAVLAQTAAQQNLDAMPQLEQLSQMINQINMMANQARIPGGAALEEASSRNIAEELSGYLPQDYLEQLQTTLAQRGVGFGADNPNTNAAALRAMGLSKIDRQNLGAQHLTAAFNRAAPLWNVQEGMVTPALLSQRDEFGRTLAEQRDEFGRTLEQRMLEFTQTMGFQNLQLQAQIARDNADRASREAMQYADINGANSRQALALAEQARQANQANQLAQEKLQAEITNAANDLQYKYAALNHPDNVSGGYGGTGGAQNPNIFNTPSTAGSRNSLPGALSYTPAPAASSSYNYSNTGQYGQGYYDQFGNFDNSGAYSAWDDFSPSSALSSSSRPLPSFSNAINTPQNNYGLPTSDAFTNYDWLFDTNPVANAYSGGANTYGNSWSDPGSYDLVDYNDAYDPVSDPTWSELFW